MGADRVAWAQALRDTDECTGPPFFPVNIWANLSLADERPGCASKSGTVCGQTATVRTLASAFGQRRARQLRRFGATYLWPGARVPDG